MAQPEVIEPFVVDVEPVEPCSEAICASNACTCAWSWESVSAFAGVAKANAKPRTKAAERTMLAMFVVNALLIIEMINIIDLSHFKVERQLLLWRTRILSTRVHVHIVFSSANGQRTN